MPGGFEAGERFGDFEIIEVAGRGGMGIVYRARQITLERIVALKVISPEIADAPDFTTRFHRESRLAASIDHPHVVSIYSAGEAAGRAYIAMQWVDGSNLDALLADRVPLAEARTFIIVSQLAGALDAAHSRGLVHRDVKPPNVLVRSIAGADHCYLTDFGIARRVDLGATGLTKTGQTVGTVGYMAPEQIRGERSDGRADIYSLGCVLYQCLTGRRPFEHDTEVAVMFAHVNEERPRPSLLRAELAPYDDLVARALALDPGDRFQTGAELGAALGAATTGAPPPMAAATVPSASTPAGETRTAATAHLEEPPAPPPPPRREPAGAATRSSAAPAGATGSGSGRRVLLGLGAVLLVGAIAFGAFVAAGGLDDSGGSTTIVNGTGEGSDETGRSNGGGNGEDGGGGGGGGGEPALTEAAEKAEIQTTLEGYESAYTRQDTADLQNLFTEDVTRRGLRAGGCSTTSGIDEVLATYEEQFAAGTGDYSLTDTSEGAIQLDGDVATVDTGYTISSGASGTISFELSRSDRTWLISSIYASC